MSDTVPPPFDPASLTSDPSSPLVLELESLLEVYFGLRVALETPAAGAVQRLDNMVSEAVMDQEAQGWEQYSEELCLPLVVIQKLYGGIPAFGRLIRSLMILKRKAAGRVCNALANIPIGR
jgi:hypothetical protein